MHSSCRQPFNGSATEKPAFIQVTQGNTGGASPEKSARMNKRQAQKKQDHQAVDLPLQMLCFDELELIPTAPTDEDQHEIVPAPDGGSCPSEEGHLCMNPSTPSWLRHHEHVEPR